MMKNICYFLFAVLFLFFGCNNDDGSDTENQLLNEFISMNFEGQSYDVTEIKRVVLSPDRIIIEANYNPLGSPFFSFTLEDAQLGVNIADRVHIGNIDENINLGCNNAGSFPICSSNLNVQITKLDDFIGGYISGSIEGQVWDEAGSEVNIEVEFNVIIDFKLIEVHGRVWDDLNKDGIQDANEPGIPDVLLTSVVQINSSGSYGARTDENGYYTTLSTLGEPAILRMFEIQNGEYVITLQGQGSDPNMDSDFSPSTREVEKVIALEGATNQWDCGAYKP